MAKLQSRSRYPAVILLLCLQFALPASPVEGTAPTAARMVRVGLFRLHALREVTVQGEGGALRPVLDGRELVPVTRGRLTFRNGRALFERPGLAMPGHHLVLEPAAGGRIRVLPPGLPSRAYRGRIQALAREGRWLLINEVDVESYLRGLLPSEMPPDWPVEALKAQAVAARTYIYANLGKHRTEGFDFSDLTEDQLYRGADAEDPRTDRALRLTRGGVLTWNGHPIQALYTSTCGGIRPGNRVIFGGPALPYLAAQADRDARGRAYCRESDHYPVWSVSYRLGDLQRALAGDALTDPGETFRGLKVHRDPASGYVQAVIILGQPHKTVTAYRFWSAVGPAFGWGEIKSLAFKVQQEGDRLTFIGRGCGHGVGMCQWGARGRAQAGWDYRRILQHYFPGAVLTPGDG